MKMLLPCSGLLLALLVSPFAQAAKKGDSFGYVGTYTRGESKGIYVFRFSASTGKAGPVELAAETPNPSFLAVHPNGRQLYSVSEMAGPDGTPGGTVSAFSLDRRTGKLTFLNKTSTRGTSPCHLVVDKTGTNVLLANYSSGSVAVIPLKADGSLKEVSGFVQHTGSSVDARRQRGPHAHSINLSADNRFAVVADLGLDQLLVYRFDPVAGTLTPNEPPFLAIKPGSGPRHFAFHPNGKFAYQINEMASTVGALSYDKANGAFKHLQYISTLPADFKGDNTTAEVQAHRSGKFVYGSNRGHDTVAAFSVNKSDGTLTYVGNYGAGGRVIRNFGIDPTGKYLFAAHQNSNFIAVFKIDQKTGQLTATGEKLNAGAPVCVKFVTAE